MTESQHIFEHAEMLLREQSGPLPAGLTQAVNDAWRNRNRPHFADPAAYARYCGECWARGKTPFEPSSVEQLVAVNDAYPEETRQHFRVCARELRAMGLPADFFEPIKPQGDREFDEFLAGLEEKPERLKALLVLLRGAARQ